MVLLADYGSLTGENAKYSNCNSATNQNRPRKANTQRELPKPVGQREPTSMDRARKKFTELEHSSGPRSMGEMAIYRKLRYERLESGLMLSWSEDSFALEGAPY
jgi:hypothetical protein